MVRVMAILVVAFVSLAYSSSTAQQSATNPSVTQIMQGMSANIAGISSFQVPVHIVFHVKKGMFSVPVTVDGDRYFKLPDRNALKVSKSGNPELTDTLKRIYALIDAPTTWERTHDITLQGTGDVDGHHAYALSATVKRSSSNVDHLILDVDTTTFDPVRARWFLRNGGTVTMHMRQGVVDGKYRLAQHDDVVFALPKYHGTASVDYGTFAINVPVADSVFAQQPAD